MSAANQATVNLVGAGGSPPYTFLVVAGASTTIPATLSGTTLTVDATNASEGTYSVEIQITDHLGATSTKVFKVEALNPSSFAILNRDLNYLPSSLPSSNTVNLTSVGGNGTISWSLLPLVTTLPGAAISGSVLSFSLTSLGSWVAGLRATDSVGNTVTQLINVTVASSTVVSVVDGHALLSVAATDSGIGTHQFTISVTDSDANTSHSSFNYFIDSPVSAVDIAQTAVNHVWGPGDTTEIVLPIEGDLTGFGIGSSTPIVAANGITTTVDPSTGSAIFTGGPSAFGNSEVQVQIPIIKGTTQIAELTREFSLVSINNGTMTSTTRPYIVGDMVGLNPLRPYFNSPSTFKNVGYAARVALNSKLPLGLSLDAVTGLIYGTVLAADVTESTIQYVDGSNVVQAVITILWDIVVSQFQMIDNLVDGQIQAIYSANLSSSSSAVLTSVSLHRGALPQGMTLSIGGGGTQVVLSGTPTQAGFYDVWIEVGNASGQTAYHYKRLAIEYIPPLIVVTDTLNQIQNGVQFSQPLYATGGVQPYTWAIVGGVLPTGVTFSASSGILSGSTLQTPYSSNLLFQVTDARGVTATAALALTVNNTLSIATPVLPIVTPGVNYGFQLQAQGGQGGYVWSLGTGSAALPGGFSLSASGVLSGATSLVSFSENIIIQVKDTANNTATQTFALSIGSTFNLIIDTEGVGPIVRGSAYTGRLSVIGNGIAPYSWAVTNDTPNPLPSGFVLTADASNSGATATLSGTTTSALLNDSVKVRVVDANGNTAVAFLLLDSYSNLAITTVSIPQATVGGNYITQFAGTGINPPFTWSLDPTSAPLPGGLTLTTSGLLTGTPTAASTATLVIRLTDSLGDFTTQSFAYQALSSTLAITTPSLPGAYAGVPYGGVLAASGGTPGYTWSVSPNSAALLPNGFTLGATTGAITGSSLQGGYSKNVTFRVTDSIGVYREATFLITVASAISFLTGPDSVQGTSTGSLGIVSDGDVTGIYPHPNLSFCVTATKFISTSAAGFSFGLPAGFSASVVSMTNGVAIFQLAGPFAAGAVGSNTFNFSLSDSGVNASATFTWSVSPQLPIAVVPIAGSLPILSL